MTAHERLLRSVPDAPWLPPGGRADIVLSRGGACPEPASLVRLLVEHDQAVFCVARDGSGKTDLPTTTVAPHETGPRAAARLAADVLGPSAELTVRGYVRNTVLAGRDYPWPTPCAHFVVFDARASAARVRGTWVPLGAPGDLVERHWWPLVG